jgi:hypothetical protein
MTRSRDRMRLSGRGGGRRSIGHFEGRERDR